MSKAVTKPDVVVIGGGVAGAAAATWLAEGGREVLLLEKEKKVHDKVCGEFIGPTAQNYINKLGWNPEALSASTMRNLRLIKGSSSFQQALPFIARGLSRACLDDMLLQKADKAGATIRRGVKAVRLRRKRGWEISLAGGEEVATPSVFLATGKHELRGWRREVKGQSSDYIGFKQHYRLKPDQQKILTDYIEVFLYDSGYAGLAPLGQEHANLCMVVSRKQFKRSGNCWRSFLRSLTAATPLLEERLRGGIPVQTRPLAIYGLPYGYLFKASRHDPPGLYRLGDQMAVIPSFSGEGIAIALHTAYHAAECLLEDQNSFSYHQKVRQDLKPAITKGLALSSVMENRISRPIGYAACRVFPALTTSLIRNIRL